MIETIIEAVKTVNLSELDYLVIVVNLFTLLGSGFLIQWAAHNRTEKELKKRVAALRLINIFVLSSYLLAVIFQFKLGQAFSQLALTLMVAFSINHLAQSWILKRFGTEREINDKTITVRSYTSGMIGLLALLLVLALTFVAILNILDLKNWLQASSIIGAFVLILYASKDYLLADMISSLLLHYNRSLEPGAVIRVNELSILGVVQQITLTQTMIRDLVQGHNITLPNSKIRQAVIENLSNSSGLIRDYIDFNIGYEATAEQVTELLNKSWTMACEQDSTIAIENATPSIRLIENADHCVVWRLIYQVQNPYKILEMKQAINLAAFKLSKEMDIGLNTPLTHQAI